MDEVTTICVNADSFKICVDWNGDDIESEREVDRKVESGK